MIKTMPPLTARQTALQILHTLETQHAYTDLVLRQVLQFFGQLRGVFLQFFERSGQRVRFAFADLHLRRQFAQLAL